MEAGLIGGGSLVLFRRQAARWIGWWAGLCVALHFIPLAWVFDDWSYLVLGVVQVAGLAAMFPVLRRHEYATSRWAAPWVAATFLAYAALSAVIFLTRHGYPF